jgi:thioredoxin-like negative regulator of GroEL
MAPVLRELSLRLKDQVRIGRVNVDAFPAIAARFQVLGVPTLMFFCRGETFAHVIGFQAAPALKRWLTQTLNACIECEDK